MELDIIIWMQSWRSEALDTIMKLITMFGDQIFFLGVMSVLLYGYNKKYAYLFFTVYVAGLLFVGCLKSLIARPRPYTQQQVISISEKTSGYSMPSGHTYSITNICTQIYCENNKKHYYSYRLLIITSIVISFLVAISRLYLGQHYFSDVIVGAIVGVTVGYFMTFVVIKLGDKEELLGYFVIPVALIVGIIASFINETEVSKIAGASIGVFFGYILEKRFINYTLDFDTVKVLLRIAIGCGVSIGLHILLQALLPHSSVMEFLRYLLIALWAMLGAFYIFKKLKI